MSVVSLLGVKIVNNPAPFLAPYQFEITFECLEQLQKGNILKMFFTAEVRFTNNRVARLGMETHLRRLCYIVSQSCQHTNAGLLC
jgi:hypothetical protein